MYTPNQTGWLQQRQEGGRRFSAVSVARRASSSTSDESDPDVVEGGADADTADSASASGSSPTPEEVERDVWARTELPLSNDQQVQQATDAVWKVSTHVVVRCSCVSVSRGVYS